MNVDKLISLAVVGLGSAFFGGSVCTLYLGTNPKASLFVAALSFFLTNIGTYAFVFFSKNDKLG